LKATTLATVISLKELMTITQFVIATSFRFLEWYGAALFDYMAMVSGSRLAPGFRVARNLAAQPSTMPFIASEFFPGPFSGAIEQRCRRLRAPQHEPVLR
jgi:hypothetical protein